MSIEFTINNQTFKVLLDEFPVDTTLNTFIRDHAQLFGTKFLCLEGGCGACIVTIKGRHIITRNYKIWAANSCLTLLYTCDGWKITTIEGIGNKTIGYHPIQERLAHINGSQCGYCSPGMVMNMYSLMKANSRKVSMKEIENSFGGNLCRCTGYRPILDAMKSFSIDSEYEYVDLCNDIEDLGKQKCTKNNGKPCEKNCIQIRNQNSIKDHRKWCFPNNLYELFLIIHDIEEKSYILIGGNTGHGVYRRDERIVDFIDTKNVPELHVVEITDNSVDIGGNVTLTEFMSILDQACFYDNFKYCQKFIKHIDKVANVPVRNMGTIAGNLMLKHEHNEFPSDIFLILSTVDAKISVAISPTNIIILSMIEFLHYDMTRCVILKISLPPLKDDQFIFKSYKITPRAQNAHAYVNAAFLFNISNNIIQFSRLCFGGINPRFIEAKLTSNYLQMKNIFDDEIFRKTIEILIKELRPDWILPDASPEYRLKLACGLFYKFILKITPKLKIKSEYRSGGSLIKRPISSGSQSFETKEDKWPLTKPIIKIEALVQCSGEATYMNDLAYLPKQVWAAFVHATQVKSKIAKIDTTDALKIPGVIAFFCAKDIPGINSFVTIGLFGIAENEEIFCDDIVKYHCQPVGIIVAETLDLAKEAAKKVEVLYEHREKILIPTLQDAMEHNLIETFKNNDNTDLKNTLSQDALSVNGHFEMGGQFHFSMETHTTVCVPNEDGMIIYSSTQNIDMTQVSIANALNINENSMDLQVRRLGGSYGCKISRSGLVATACALACFKLTRPVRFVQSLESNMSVTGKRNGCICNYAVKVDPKGIIQKFSIKYYEDFGCSKNDDPMTFFTTPAIPNCYKNDGWTINGEAVLTDAPSHTWCRAPGTLEGVSMTENILEHISRVVKRDPVDVRFDNIPNDSKMKILLPKFIKSVDYKSRKIEIENFNKSNRWRKKGIAISLMKYPIFYFGSYPATVTIYHWDGTVCITHGGVEMGQGLNTKVIQVASFVLGISLGMIVIKPSNSFNGANTFVTGGSITSESVCSAVKQACEKLLERMKPIRESMTNPKWTDITRKCYQQNISLIEHHLYKLGDLTKYDVWGLACSEVEIDILTGNFQLNRVDILEDTGESLSPLIDVGQIEGAFIMGIGYWLTEKLIFNRQNGELLTNRTWNYKIPGAKDIPVDFRINLLQKSPNPNGLLRSKTTGECAICLSISAIFALRHGIDSARSDAKISDIWYHLGAPTTPENIVLNAGHNVQDFGLV